MWFVNSGAPWRERLAKPQYRICFEHDEKIPMRDGVRLSANVWRPASSGRFPVVLIMTPYDNASATWVLNRARYLVPRGYVVAAVDVRGRYDSEGTFYLYWSTEWKKGRFDGEDVFDCQSWLGEQTWSNGRIGMTGGSYLGFVQWMAAPFRNPYVKALIPWISPDDHHDNIYPNGAMQLSNSINLLAILGTATRDNKEPLRQEFWDWDALYRHLPLRTMDQALFGRTDQMWQDLLDHPDNDAYWRFSVGERSRAGEMNCGKYAEVAVPTLNITGWYDQVSQATINNFIGMTSFGPPELRGLHQLIVGPWRHGHSLPRTVGEVDFGENAEVDFLAIEQRWFDRWLKEIDNGIDGEPAVSIFVMGENSWRGEAVWPVARARTLRLYLSSAGAANTNSGDGRLVEQLPDEEVPDAFIYDPTDPVPTCGGNVSMYGAGITGGPLDQRRLQSRNDVLVYTGVQLDQKIEVTGRILVKLWARTSATDTDFTAKLVDVHPNGWAQILAEGIIRGRYRESFGRQKLLVPGQEYEFTIDLWSISHAFLTGHRIQLEVSSSNFPKYDRNPNTGERFGESTALEIAKQTVFHDKARPSYIDLPIMR